MRNKLHALLILAVSILVMLIIVLNSDNKINVKANIRESKLSISANTLSNFIETPANLLIPYNKNTGYIFIGDSRFVGMNTACNITNNRDKFVIAKVGEGYEFLINEAIPKAESIESEYKDIDSWVYIICLGVNDLYNIDKYIETYKGLAKEKELYIVSVNPIEYHSSINNANIEMFNKKLMNVKNAVYIDSYSILLKDGYNTVDGLHYTKSTYQLIYNEINKKIQETNA